MARLLLYLSLPGHGDVHALMYSTGTAKSWLSKGTSWAFFFQDTNGLAFFTLAAQLGVSLKLGLEVNSMTVPRVAKQAVGAITRLVRSDGWSVTANVEYNQLDPLLRANGEVY
jgi:UDP-sugar pyrophosphorylase